MKYVYPIKDRKKIAAMRKILAADSKRNELLFLLGINTALRISDILKLRYADLYNEKGKPLEKLYNMNETKTRKNKSFMIAPQLLKALQDFIKGDTDWKAEDYIFSSRKGSQPITRQHAHRIISAAAEAVGITDPIGTHTLRKSFAYHLYKDTGNIALVQKVLNHASAADTLRYIGIEQEEMDAAYMLVNLG